MTRATEQNRRVPCIVVGYDGSEPARSAVKHAAARAGGAGKVVIVFAAVRPSAVADPEFLIEDPVEHGQAVLDELLMEEAELLTETGDFALEVASGNPADVIVAAAVAHDADEIAIGTRGAGRISSLLGSVAHDVLHRADRPVLVVPKGAVDSQRDKSSPAVPTSQR